jgi:hypothetical protein
MSTATLQFESAAAADESFQYRALHTGAIIGLVLALFTSISTLVAAGGSPEGCIWVALLNAAAMSICLWSLARIRREPELYTGRPMAVIGLVASLLGLVGGLAYGGYEYTTEVPDGYTRISFNTMKPDDTQERDGVLVPPEIAALNGQKVFIKGYIRPDSVTVQRGIDRFLLVRDNNQCCFGTLSNVKYHDQVLVDMTGALRVNYSDRVLRLGGVLKIEPENIRRGPMAPVFSLKADYSAN